MTVHRPSYAAFLIGAFALAAAACGSGKTSTNPPPTGFGQLAIKLVDAPPAKSSDVASVVVTIDQVTLHSTAGGWATVFAADAQHPAITVDLLTLQNKTIDVATLDLPKGTTVTQVRLHVVPDAGANYVTLKSDPATHVPLKVPSGSQSGIKIHGPWDIAECKATAITLDFDGPNSIFEHPALQGTEWILRPVIRLKLAETLDVGCAPPATPPAPVTCDATAAVSGCGDKVCLATAAGGVCAGHPSDTCTEGAECISGNCDPTLGRCLPSGSGNPCFASLDCLNLKCDATTHTCAQGDTGDPCVQGTDCKTVCTDFRCAPPPPAVGNGQPCAQNSDCLSFQCAAGGTCDPSGQGGGCKVDADCDVSAGLVCNVPAGATVGTCELLRAR